MPRYIDLDEIRKMLDACPNKGYVEMDEIPPADVVEVVRCKDCKWWSLPENITADFYICKKFDGVRYGEDYCSRGERRKDE